MLALTIILFSALLGLIVCGLIRERVMDKRRENTLIYEKAAEAARELRNAPEKTAVSSPGNTGIKTVLTYRDLMDEEDILDYGQMNY